VNTGSGGGGGSYSSGYQGGSGVVIIAYPDAFAALSGFSGLTYSVSTTSRPGYRVYTFTAGTGTVTF
jgi:hypothetical protein